MYVGMLRVERRQGERVAEVLATFDQWDVTTRLGYSPRVPPEHVCSYWSKVTRKSDLRERGRKPQNYIKCIVESIKMYEAAGVRFCSVSRFICVGILRSHLALHYS